MLITISADSFISAFLLLIYAEAETYYQANVQFKKFRVISLVVLNTILYGISIFLGLMKSIEIFDLYIYEIATFLIVSFGLLFFTLKLRNYFQSRQEYQITTKIRTLFRIIIICIILHIIRIPLLLIAYYKEDVWFQNPWIDATYIISYYFFSEIFSVSLVIFYLFEIPPKSVNLEMIDVENVTEKTPILDD
ncbi:tobamovirus multiplication protein 1-like isoform x1 [Anaeramoeba flamelloides]|uniref:Tobamovirus multiplication protein 1-like isoform x1 n=1 Tax=Anaeramoeba flamelloides TaxID=1746091 RepID=A0ABQ8XBJ4_9EUKA|nr:tobamovirus multiplication protein 1-like isoform x1 [Anaeramoeba flamelloides]